MNFLTFGFFKKNKNIKMVASWAIKIDKFNKKIGEIKTSNIVPERNINLLMSKEFIPHSTVMFKLSYGRKYGGYPNYLKYAQDFGLILKFIEKKQLKIIPFFLSKIRFTPGSMSFRDEYKKIIIQDRLNLLNYVKKKFYLNKIDIIKYYFYILKVYLKLLIIFFKRL